MKTRLRSFSQRCFPYVVIGLVPVLISACRQSSSSMPVSPDVKLVVDGNNAFAVDLYQQLKGQQSNLFFSPFSIYASLAMVHAGARGQTEKEVENVLHINLSLTNTSNAFRSLATQMNDVQSWNHVTLAMANSLWAQQDYGFNGDFLTSVKKNYQADAYNVDFKSSPQSASERINTWVDEKTKGNIKYLVKADQLAKDERLMLCNAIYFKGKWAQQFDVKDTQPSPFFISSNETVSVPMMHQNSSFKMAYIDDNDLCLLELPYIRNDFSMVILLPGNVDGLATIEQQLSAEKLQGWLDKLRDRSESKIDVEIPRFKSSKSYDLVKVLNRLGASMLFGSQGRPPLVSVGLRPRPRANQPTSSQITLSFLSFAKITLAIFCFWAGSLIR